MIRLCVFGPPTISREGRGSLDDICRQTKRFALLVYLACEDCEGAHRRDRLLAMFWPEADETRGRNALRQSLYFLRNALGSEVINGNGSEELQVNRNSLSSDLNSFLKALGEDDPERALALYRGDFLSGFHLSGSPDFESWVEDQRHCLRGMAANLARDLAHRAEGSRDLPNAIHWWRKSLDLAPFDEKALRRLMSLLAGSGNRGQAMSEFLHFRREASNQLGATLSQETMDLARKISEGQQAFDLEWILDRRQGDRCSTPRFAGVKRAGDLNGISSGVVDLE